MIHEHATALKYRFANDCVAHVEIVPSGKLHRVIKLTDYKAEKAWTPGDSHRGTWKALLGLRIPGAIVTTVMTHVPKAQAEYDLRLLEFIQKPTPYNLTVHTYSNLTLDATLRQEGFAPGNAVHLTASLWEYRVPLTTVATVWADVIQPDGSRVILPFWRTSAGDYRADWTTTRPGVYLFAIHAEGRTTGNARFTREKELTAGVWAGGDRPFEPIGGGDQGDGNHGKDDAYCKTVRCLIEHAKKSPVLREHFRAIGIDLESLSRCLESPCGQGKPTGEERPAETASSEERRTLTRTPEFDRLISALASSGLTDLKLLGAAKTTPVIRKPKLKANDENMFLRPVPPKHKGNKHEKRKE